MNKLLLFLMLTLCIVACKKNDDPAPDDATSVSGTYQLSVVGQDAGDGKGYSEITLPISVSGQTVSGTMTVTRVNASAVTLAVQLKQTGVADQNVSIGQVTLQKNSSSYDMLGATSNKIGTIDGTNVLIDVVTAATATTKAGRAVFKGKK